jgi:outer membrane protein
MKSKFVFSLMAVAVLIASAASAQTSSSSTGTLPAAPGAVSNDPLPVTLNPANKGLASINVEQAIFASNEGQRDMEALSKKFEPKSNELKSQNDEIEGLKKKVNTATADAKPELQRELEQKQKSLDRAAQDAREDFQTQQNEIGQRILQKMAPVIIQVANNKGAGMIVDTSQPWPQGPVLATSGGVDITKDVVDAYNAKSGIAPPAQKSGSTKPPGNGATSRPASTGTTKPSASASKPGNPTTPAR